MEWDLEAGPAVVRDGMTILRLSFSPVSESSAFLPNFGVVAGIPVAGEAEAGFDVAGGGAVGRRSGCG